MLILGIVFVVLLLPILHNLSDVICLAFEMIKTRISIKIESMVEKPVEPLGFKPPSKGEDHPND